MLLKNFFWNQLTGMNSGKLSGRLSWAISAFNRFLWFGFLIPMAVKSSGVILPIVGKS